MQGLARKIFYGIFAGSVLLGCGTRAKVTSARSSASDTKKDDADQVVGQKTNDNLPPGTSPATPGSDPAGPPPGIPASTLSWDGTSLQGVAELQLVPMN